MHAKYRIWIHYSILFCIVLHVQYTNNLSLSLLCTCVILFVPMSFPLYLSFLCLTCTLKTQKEKEGDRKYVNKVGVSADAVGVSFHAGCSGGDGKGSLPSHPSLEHCNL